MADVDDPSRGVPPDRETIMSNHLHRSILRSLSLVAPTLSLVTLTLSLVTLTLSAGLCRAQQMADSSSLPDAPSSARSTSTSVATAPAPTTAGIHQRYVAEGQTAPGLSAGDKILLGLSNAVSERAVAGWVGVSLFEQGLDHSPQYGQSFKGYTQRLGAAAARDGSQDIFSDAVLAPILHEDPRYYQLGPGHGVVRRTLYAATRTLITRSDNGSATANVSLLGGNLAGSVLTQAYYPPNSTGFGDTMRIFGGSLGGSAFGFIVDEFLHDRVEALQEKF